MPSSASGGGGAGGCRLVLYYTRVRSQAITQPSCSNCELRNISGNPYYENLAAKRVKKGRRMRYDRHICWRPLLSYSKIVELAAIMTGCEWTTASLRAVPRLIFKLNEQVHQACFSGVTRICGWFSTFSGSDLVISSSQRPGDF